MMFFRSVCAVFSGFSSFPEFSGRHPLRALFHLLLFCLLSALICGGIKTRLVGRTMEPCMRELEQTFGSVKVSSAGILPSRDAATPRTFILPGSIRLDYLTKESVPVLREMGEWEQLFGILWVPDGFLLWMRTGPAANLFYLTQIPLPSLSAAARVSPAVIQYLYPVESSRIEKTARRSFQRPARPNLSRAETFGFPEIGKKIRGYFYVMYTISFMLGKFFLSLTIVLMFSGMQALWKAPGLENLGFGKTFSMLCYAAYPAVAAGMLLESFSFFNGSELVFFILFFIGQLLAFNEIRRAQSGPDAGNGAGR